MILLQKCNPLVLRQQKTSRSLSEAWKRSAGYVAYKTADYSVTAGVITALATDLRTNLRSDSDWRSSLWQQCARRALFALMFIAGDSADARCASGCLGLTMIGHRCGQMAQNPHQL